MESKDRAIGDSRGRKLECEIIGAYPDSKCHWRLSSDSEFVALFALITGLINGLFPVISNAPAVQTRFPVDATR